MQSEIDFCRKEYAKQKTLEKIVTSRVLVRPNVKKWQVATSFAILPFLLFSLIFLIFLSSISRFWKVGFSIVVAVVVFEVYLRFCFLLVVKTYQHYAKEETRRRCKCIPSCSEYAVICLKKVFPLILALLKIRKRLFFTCNGEEYKIDFPTKKMGEKYESKI